MADGRGRPRTPIGGIGKVGYSPSADGVTAATYTRVASGARRRIQETAATEELALEALRAKAAKLGLVVATSADVVTLGQMLDRWLEDVVESRNMKSQSKRSLRTKAGRLKGWYGGIRLDELRAARLQLMLNEIASVGSAETYRGLHGVLNRTLNWAVMLEVLPGNALSATETPRLMPKAPPISLTAHQLQVFRQAFADYVDEGVRESNRRKAQLVVECILGLGGLRISEALAIRHRDVDFETGTVDIIATVVYEPGESVFRQDGLKHDRQKRGLTLNLDGIGMKALRAARDECPPYRSRPDEPLLGRVEPDESAWMNPSIPSEHFDNVTFRPEVVAALAETGLKPQQLTPHTLRRTVATLVAHSKDGGTERAAEVMVHWDTKVTVGSYITPKGKKVDITTLDGILSE